MFFYIFIVLFSFFSSLLEAIAPLNLIRPYDETFLFLPLKDARFECNFLYEQSTNISAAQECFNSPHFLYDKVNPLQIYQTEQDSLAALKGSTTNSAIGQLAQAFTVDDDNDNRGHFLPSGKLDFYNGILTARYTTHHVSFTASLPYCMIELKNVLFKNLTNNTTAEDALVRNLLTDNFKESIWELGHLAIGNYKRHGLSDLYLGATYNQLFPHKQGLLSNVNLQIQGGFTLPTGKKRDINQLFAFEFGNNGSVGAVFGGGIDLNYVDRVRIGGNAQFLYIFGNSNCERIKTDLAQTDLLFLTTAKAYTQWGLTQKFYIYGELYKIIKNISLQAGYQYIRHDNDKLYVSSNSIYLPIVNSAQSLQEWTINTLVLKARYEHDEELPDRCWSPRIEFFYKKGFNGRNSLISSSIGGHVSFSF
jgi:hypothetical protein